MLVNGQGHVHLIGLFHGAVKGRQEFAPPHFNQERFQPGIGGLVSTAHSLFHPGKEDFVVSCGSDFPGIVELGHALHRGVISEVGQEPVALLVHPVVPRQISGTGFSSFPGSQSRVHILNAGAGYGGTIGRQAGTVNPSVQVDRGQCGGV